VTNSLGPLLRTCLAGSQCRAHGRARAPSEDAFTSPFAALSSSLVTDYRANRPGSGPSGALVNQLRPARVRQLTDTGRETRYETQDSRVSSRCAGYGGMWQH
jgi:hypothetical protein